MNEDNIPSIRFEVEHYGKRVERFDKMLMRESYGEWLTFKVYVLGERYFVEIWFNGECLSFIELPN